MTIFFLKTETFCQLRCHSQAGLGAENGFEPKTLRQAGHHCATHIFLTNIDILKTYTFDISLFKVVGSIKDRS